MRKILLTLFLTNLGLSTFAQVITGDVFDDKTKRKIENAVIYFNGTFNGTYTDEKGHFAFDISKYPSIPVTVSSGGYYSLSFDIVAPEKPVELYLKPKVFESDEINSGSKVKEDIRGKNLRQFKSTFLGVTPNARFCELLNERDILFTNDDDSDTLKAFASDPIIIYNNALGYKASYFLDEFILNTRDETFFYSGNIFFTEDLAANTINNQNYLKKRAQAYPDSRIFFFRSLWENNLESAGFVVKNAENEDLGYDRIVIDKGISGKYLKHFENPDHPDQGEYPSMYIIFREKEVFYDSWGRLDRSCITQILLSHDVFFDKTGYFDPAQIDWSGKLSKQRIADLLPLEY